MIRFKFFSLLALLFYIEDAKCAECDTKLQRRLCTFHSFNYKRFDPTFFFFLMLHFHSLNSLQKAENINKRKKFEFKF